MAKAEGTNPNIEPADESGSRDFETAKARIKIALLRYQAAKIRLLPPAEVKEEKVRL